MNPVADRRYDVLGWRAWYADGTVYDSRATAWERLPDDGVLVVVVYFTGHSDGVRLRRLMSGTDYYFFVPPDIFAQSNDVDRDIRKRYPGAQIKSGRWVADAVMHWATEAALAAVDF